jgi:hypothetical protein
VPFLEQPVGKMGADESGAAEGEDLHDASICLRWVGTLSGIDLLS